MKAATLSRIEALESRTTKAYTPIRIRMGNLRRLPQDYPAERHIVVVKRHGVEANGLERCEYEEQPGPAPEDSSAGFNSNVHYLDVRFVEPYPVEE